MTVVVGYSLYRSLSLLFLKAQVFMRPMKGERLAAAANTDSDNRQPQTGTNKEPELVCALFNS